MTPGLPKFLLVLRAFTFSSHFNGLSQKELMTIKKVRLRFIIKPAIYVCRPLNYFKQTVLWNKNLWGVK